MTNDDRLTHCSARLWGMMQHWLGFRQGREAAQQDAGKHVDSPTNRWLETLDHVGHDYPADLAVASLAILAEARGYTFREMARALLEADRDPQAELPEVDNLILAVHYQARQQRHDDHKQRVTCECGSVLDWPVTHQEGDPCGTDGVCEECSRHYPWRDRGIFGDY